MRMQPTTFRGQDAAIWEMSWTGETHDLRAIDLGWGKEGEEEYAVWLSAPYDDWDEYLPVFNNVRAGLLIGNGAGTGPRRSRAARPAPEPETTRGPGPGRQRHRHRFWCRFRFQRLDDDGARRLGGSGLLVRLRRGLLLRLRRGADAGTGSDSATDDGNGACPVPLPVPARDARCQDVSAPRDRSGVTLMPVRA
ncbi:hypothetical protein NKH77_23015 [Streptomyces sp. M19]